MAVGPQPAEIQLLLHPDDCRGAGAVGRELYRSGPSQRKFHDLGHGPAARDGSLARPYGLVGSAVVALPGHDRPCPIQHHDGVVVDGSGQPLDELELEGPRFCTGGEQYQAREKNQSCSSTHDCGHARTALNEFRKHDTLDGPVWPNGWPCTRHSGQYAHLSCP
jgi:hypothetical protein